VPFLIQPDIKLLSLQRLAADQRGEPQAPQQLEARWALQSTLALPWRPFISIVGRTVYTLNPQATQIVCHEEFWNVSAAQALLQMFTPGRRRQQQP
jgi:hypothetical protein